MAETTQTETTQNSTIQAVSADRWAALKHEFLARQPKHTPDDKAVHSATRSDGAKGADGADESGTAS